MDLNKLYSNTNTTIIDLQNQNLSENSNILEQLENYESLIEVKFN